MAKYSSTDGEVLEFCGVWWISPKDVIPTERSDEGSLIHQPSSIIHQPQLSCPFIVIVIVAAVRMLRCQSQPIYELSPIRDI